MDNIALNYKVIEKSFDGAVGNYDLSNHLQFFFGTVITGDIDLFNEFKLGYINKFMKTLDVERKIEEKTDGSAMLVYEVNKSDEFIIARGGVAYLTACLESPKVLLDWDTMFINKYRNSDNSIYKDIFKEYFDEKHLINTAISLEHYTFDEYVIEYVRNIINTEVQTMKSNKRSIAFRMGEVQDLSNYGVKRVEETEDGITILPYAFKDIEGIDVIYFDKPVTLFSQAFAECSIKTIILGGLTKETLEGPPLFNLFKDSTELENVYLSRNLTYIGESWFEGCTNLKRVCLPSILKRVHSYAFKSSGIEEIILPFNTHVIDHNVFEDCKNLKSVTFNHGLKTMGHNVFNGCDNLKDVKILTNNKDEYGEPCFNLYCNSFNWCPSLKSITLDFDTVLVQADVGEGSKAYHNYKTVREICWSRLNPVEKEDYGNSNELKEYTGEFSAFFPNAGAVTLKHWEYSHPNCEKAIEMFTAFNNKNYHCIMGILEDSIESNTNYSEETNLF